MATSSIAEQPKTAAPIEVSLVRFAGYFLWLGTVGLGDPIALAGHMQQDLVEERHWIRNKISLRVWRQHNWRPALWPLNSQSTWGMSVMAFSARPPWPWRLFSSHS